jgi:hypothetical protein
VPPDSFPYSLLQGIPRHTRRDSPVPPEHRGISGFVKHDFKINCFLGASPETVKVRLSPALDAKPQRKRLQAVSTANRRIPQFLVVIRLTPWPLQALASFLNCESHNSPLKPRAAAGVGKAAAARVLNSHYQAAAAQRPAVRIRPGRARQAGEHNPKGRHRGGKAPDVKYFCKTLSRRIFHNNIPVFEPAGRGLGFGRNLDGKGREKRGAVSRPAF